MKRLIRRIVRRINDATARWACTTNGDYAEIHSGPCSRCVGRALAELPREMTPDEINTWKRDHPEEYARAMATVPATEGGDGG